MAAPARPGLKGSRVRGREISRAERDLVWVGPVGRGVHRAGGMVRLAHMGLTTVHVTQVCPLHQEHGLPRREGRGLT